MAVARKNLAFAMNIAAAVRNFDRDAARQRHIAFVAEQRLAREMNRDQ